MKNLALLFALISGACINQVVDYEFVDGTVRCYDYDDRSTYYVPGEYSSLTCSWYCADYRGHTDSYVSLSFATTGDGWYLESEYIDSGICN